MVYFFVFIYHKLNIQVTNIYSKEGVIIMKKTEKKEIVIEKTVDSYFCDGCGKHVTDVARDDPDPIMYENIVKQPEVDDPGVNYRINLPNGYYFLVLLCDDCKKKMQELENNYRQKILEILKGMEESERVRFSDIARRPNSLS